MRKGQVEIMGLMIVVVLIIIGGVFYLKYCTTQPVNTQAEANIRQIQTINAVKALMNLKVCEVDMKQAIYLCANDMQLCNEDACLYLNKFITEVYDKILEDDYLFVINKGESELLSIGACEFGVSSGPYLIEEQRSKFEITLKVCYKS